MSSFFFSFIFFFISAFGVLNAVPSKENVTLIHTEDRKTLHENMKNSFDNAKESILLFTFSFSDPEIAAILERKKQEGVSVVIVLDKDHRGPALTAMPSVEIVTRMHGEGRIHHKIAVVDREYIWIGSANFTDSAYHNQENLMTGFYSKELAIVLHDELEVFRKSVSRKKEILKDIVLGEQSILFSLLPHDGFPQKPTEKYMNEEGKKLLFKLIKEAKESIQVAMMTWTDTFLRDAIIEASKRGVFVEIVSQDSFGEIPFLIRHGISVFINPKFQLMHNKYMVIDQKILVNGSPNWSKSSFTRNDESFIVLFPLNESQRDYLKNYWNYLTGKSF